MPCKNVSNQRTSTHRIHVGSITAGYPRLPTQLQQVGRKKACCRRRVRSQFVSFRWKVAMIIKQNDIQIHYSKTVAESPSPDSLHVKNEYMFEIIYKLYIYIVKIKHFVCTAYQVTVLLGKWSLKVCNLP